MAGNDVPMVERDTRELDAPRPGKRLVVGGVDSQRLNEARDEGRYQKELAEYHKLNATTARVDRREAREENKRLHSELAQAQDAIRLYDQETRRLQADVMKARATIAQLEGQESQFVDQMLTDENNINAMRHEVVISKKHLEESSARAQLLNEQLIEAMRVQHERNEEVRRIERERNEEARRVRLEHEDEAHAKDSEVLELRAKLATAERARREHEKWTPQRKRKGRVSELLLANTSVVTIELPLDPAPFPNAGPAASPRTSSGLSPGNKPYLTALAAELGMKDTVGRLAKGLSKLTTAANVKTFIDNSDDDDDRPEKRSLAARKEEVQPDDEQLRLNAKRMTRKATYKYFQLEQQTDFAFHQSASIDAVEDFASGAPMPPNVVQLDFNDGYLHSAWNTEQMARILKIVIADDKNGLRLVEDGLVPYEYLEIVLREQLERIRGEWKKWQPKLIPEENRMETKAEATARAIVVLLDRRVKSKRATAKHKTFDRRVGTIEATIALKEEDSAVDLETWKRLLKIVQYLGPEGMSEEEEQTQMVEGTRVTTYKIKLCVWREPTVADYMRGVDMQTKQFQQIHGGRAPAPRIRVQEVGTSKPPKGLPKCLYNSEWLGTLTPRVVTELKISKQAFALFVAATGRLVS
ncbi:hypothetical protein GGX14DRAFT_588091 [Mycena pura]|uniref:Uncharacterized protein n=1 Tax=Mycena pura TaxID=153505 RepID=A0AAD6XZD7_9AGAR|nr:hypothetical protein GGX14DRAFT_588091 [Mycena pura]